MSGKSRALVSRLAVAGSLLAVVAIGLPRAAPAAVGDALPGTPITPTAATTVDGTFVDPTCDSQGGISMAIVQGSKLFKVDPVQFPVLLVISCLDNGGGPAAVARRNRLNFIDPADGHVVKAISTTNAPSSGWTHWVNRPDKGNLLACANDGSIYSIVYNQFDNSAKVANPATPPTLTAITGSLSKSPTYFVKYTYFTNEGETLPSPEVSKKFSGGGTTGIQVTAPALPAGATGIRVYISTSTGTETKQGESATNVFNQTGALVVGTAPPSDNATGNTTGTPGTKTQIVRPAGLPASCAALAWDPEEDMIYLGVTGGTVYRFKDSGGALAGSFNTPCTPSALAITGGTLVVACDGKSTIRRLNKSTGASLSPNGTLGVLELPADTNLNPDLSDLACDPVTFQNQFKDAMWSRNGVDGNGAVALRFPPFTCGLPSGATVLWAGLSTNPTPENPANAGTAPATGCFNPPSFDGEVIDDDQDGIPDCWEGPTTGIDFDGDGTIDLQLSVQVDTNGDGIPDMTEWALPNRKDIFVEIDWMQDHKPNPQALSQTQSVATVGVTSIREAFAKAPVDLPNGIAIHFQVDEQVTFTALNGTTGKTHVSQVVLTPCTGPPSFAASQSDAADFDVIKKANFGTVSQRSNSNILNAKRLVFHYALFAHKQVGGSPGAGSNSSGCSEVGGDDLVITLGGFTTTIEGGVSHARGTKDEQAGTLMHEIGHNLGLRHGGHENVNCKPNYLSVMSYTRQFSSTLPTRRLDYSRAQLPTLDKDDLNEALGLGNDDSLKVIPGAFLTVDQTLFGPGALTAAQGNLPIDWDKDLTLGEASSAADINSAPGCDGTETSLWGITTGEACSTGSRRPSSSPVESTRSPTGRFRPSRRSRRRRSSRLPISMATTSRMPRTAGSFTCTHRIDVKPSDPNNMINLGQEANISIAIYSEINGTSTGDPAWDAVRRW